MSGAVRHLFGTISRVEFFSGRENRPLDDTINGTVAACWYSYLPKTNDRETCESGLRIHFEDPEGWYGLGDYPGLPPMSSLPLYMCVYRTEGVKPNNGRSGMSISTDTIGIAYPDICLRLSNAGRFWLDTPPITSIDIRRDNPRLSQIEWN